MQAYVLLITSIAFAVWNNCLYHSLGKKQLDNRCTWFFNAVSSLPSMLLLICFNGGIGKISQTTWFWGIAYGIITAFFLISKMTALSSGPIAVTTLIGNCSLVVPTLFGILYYNEKVSGFQLIGFLMLLISTFMCCKFSKDDKKPDKKWFLWCIPFFFSTGAVSIVLKLHQNSAVHNEGSQMMIIGYAVSSVMLTTVSLIGRNRKTTIQNIFKKDVLIFVAMCSVAGVVYNRINIYLTGALPSIIFFPIFNGGVILLVTMLGVLLYKERLNMRNTLGIILGIAAIILIGIF